MTTAGYRKNNSPGKLAARSNAYAHLSRDEIYTGKHLLIASIDCGDILHLLHLGVPAKNIIACDIDPKAREAAKSLGVVLSPFETIQDTVTWAFTKYGRKIVSVNVDLCMSVINGSPILNAVLDNMEKILGKKSSQVNVMFTYARYRDGINDGPENGKRLTYLCAKTGLKLASSLNGTGYNYVSHTKVAQGSPMSMIAFQPFRSYNKPRQSK